MQQEAVDLYQGLRNTIKERCTILDMKEPKVIADQSASKNGYKVSRPRVDLIQVVIRIRGMWMLIDISVLSSCVRSVIIAVRDWCTKILGASELEVFPSFDQEATSFA